MTAPLIYQRMKERVERGERERDSGDDKVQFK